MALFKKKSKHNNEMDWNEDGTQSGIVRKKRLKKSKNISPKDIEEIEQTTNSMNIIMNSRMGETEAQKLEQTRSVISKNYDLARRKIVLSYEDVMESGSYVTTQYLAVQVSLYLYEKKLNVKMVHDVVNKFVNYTWDKVAKGKSVAYTTEIIFEPVVYINKILPAVTITPSFAQMINTIKYDDLYEEMVRKGRLSSSHKEIIETLVEAISKNLSQGYYIKLGEPILLKVQMGSANNVVLFSNETLDKFNKSFKKNKIKNLSREVNKSNVIDHFSRTKDLFEQDKKDEELSIKKNESDKSFDEFEEEEVKRVKEINTSRSKKLKAAKKDLKKDDKEEKKAKEIKEEKKPKKKKKKKKKKKQKKK